MLHKVIMTVALIGNLIAFVGCDAEATPAATPELAAIPAVTETIVLGKVSDKPAEKIQEYQPLADYLADNLGDFDINAGEVKVARDLETMARWMASGEVDLFFDNPYAALVVSDHSGGQPILVRVKEGEDTKYGVFFALAESGTTSLGELKGQLIALEEPDSSAGYLLPMVYIIEAGLNPVEKVDPNAVVAADEVGYIFSLDDDNTVHWILNGRVAAGVVDDEAFEEVSEENGGVLVSLAKTEPILRHQITVVRPGLDPSLLEAIKTLLTDLDETEEGRAVMGPSETQRFDDLSAEWQAAVVRIQEMYDLIKDR